MVRLSELDESDEALKFVIKSVLFNTSKPFERIRAILDVAVVSISSVSPLDVASVLVLIAQLLSAFGVTSLGTTEGGVTALRQALKDSVNSPLWLTAAIDRHLRPSLLDAAAQSSSLDTIGRIWLSTSALLLELYVTDVPLDPAVRRVLLGEVMATRLSLLEEELAVVEASEVATKGISDSRRRGRLIERIATLQAGEADLGPAVGRSTDASQLAALFNEVHSFLRDVASEAAVADLVGALASGDRQASERERSFQLATAAFIHRLTVTYSDIEDLVRPITTALLFARFGMRCLARENEMRGKAADPTMSASLIFPPILAASQLQNVTPTFRGDGLQKSLIAALAHARELATPEQRVRHVPALIDQLDQIYSAWSAVRLREQQDAQAAESLYRVKKTDVEVLSDQEQEEKEFAELFPQYEDAGEDSIQSDTPSKVVEDRASFNTSDTALFNSLVAAAFGTKHHDSAKSLQQRVDQLVDSTFESSAYGEDLDRTSVAYHVARLHHRQVEIKTAATQPNFYLSANEAEVRKANRLLTTLTNRLTAIIEEWPEQMVLQHIRDRCERFLSLDVRSPVAKVLSALEQLLVHTDDWEAYANKDNSLKGFQADASALIVEWRRLELSSWMRLLDDQYEQYIASDAEWTLRLYGALVHGAVSAADVDKHLETVLPMITTYVQSSTVGQYGPRVNLLASFERLARELVTYDSAHSSALTKIAKVLHNLVANMRLFLPRIDESLRTQRATLDKAIKDFVKLASWKDVNVYALKASAVKSHRQLHRSVRKFREILQQPVAPVLSDLTSVVPQDAPQIAARHPSVIFTPSAIDQAAVEKRLSVLPPPPDHLVRLPETYARFSRIHDNAAGLASSDSTGSGLDAIAVEIIETAAELAKATPSTLTKENTKIVNNLASRKRKAFADMLKALRASGFSQNVRADQLARQQSVVWLAQRPSITADQLPEGFSHVLSKIESYHHRIAVLMMALRAAFNGHSPDINSQDLQRGIGFAESVYASAVNERDR
jgi:midasin